MPTDSTTPDDGDVADPTGGGTIPALITALGAAIAGVLGALALFGRRKPSDEVVAPTAPVMDINRDREIERRLSSLETWRDEHKEHHENLDVKVGIIYDRSLVEQHEGRTPRKRA
jgi:hypothetical protein